MSIKNKLNNILRFLKVPLLKRGFCGIFFLILFTPIVAFAEVFLQVQDTQVGTETSIQVSGLLSGEKVGFTLTRPDNTQILFSEEASELGIVQTEIFGLHLKQTGDYKLSLSRHLNPGQKIAQNFVVHLQDVSAYRSEIEVLDKSVAADGNTESRVKITLKDAYGNLAKNIKTTVLSSRNQDLLLFPEKSDNTGQLIGTVKSQTPGVSVLSVLAGEVTLFDKPEIVFYLSDSPIKNIGSPDLGKFLKAQLFEEEDFQKAAYFSIEDLPAEVVAGRNYTFRVIAKDENGNIVKNYLSPIRFASTDNQATLPADYTFQDDDQGSHTFALSITFATAGVQRFAVHELDNFDIVGELSITVVDQNATNNRSISIASPQQNAITRNQVTITGQTSGIDLLRVEDGPNILTEDLMTDEKGDFLYQTPQLADGIHKFRISSFDGSVSSQVLTIQVDSTAPESINIITDPASSLNIAQPFMLTLSSDEPLGEASCILDNQEFSLQASGDQFVANLNAPASCGEYPVSCRIADLVGNEKNAPNATVLSVCGASENKPKPSEEQISVNPTAITNLRAIPATDRVTLFWNAAEDDKAIAQYEILFGTNAQNLDQKNITPDDRTQWYVNQLNTTDKYYFQVVAIDTEGNKSPASNIVESSLESGLHSSAPATPTSGPGERTNSHIPIFLSILAAFGVILMLRRERII